jgi:tetratricopeptide (TPR) repeat protein
MKVHVVSIVIMALMLAACAPRGQQPMSAEDNPAHHYLTGMELIDRGDAAQAESHFARALQLQPDHAPALAGQALVAALAAAGQPDKEHRAVDLRRALELLERARNRADGAAQRFAVVVTGIRVLTHGQPPQWLQRAQNLYDRASALTGLDGADLPYYRTGEAADYFMALAAYKAQQFLDAEQLLAAVTQTRPGRWHAPAGTLFRKVHKIVRAMASYTLTDVARDIAIKDEVVRADVAALLVDEIHLDRLMSGAIPVPGNAPQAAFVPADISDSPFKAETLTVLKWHLRGLEPQYDATSRAYLFRPESPVKRKELAFILEDLLAKISADQTLAAAYFGQQRSPYPDVPPASPWFNAVMTAVSRNLMDPELSGAFRPEAVADGAELLLAVLRLRDAMTIY